MNRVLPRSSAWWPNPNDCRICLIRSLHEWELEITGDGPDLGDPSAFVSKEIDPGLSALAWHSGIPQQCDDPGRVRIGLIARQAMNKITDAGELLPNGIDHDLQLVRPGRSS